MRRYYRRVALSARMPELSALEVLSAIAKTGSLNAASREVGTSQQAVSARLTSIESQIGVRLVTQARAHIQNGLVGLKDMPHGFFNRGSVIVARPSMSETRLV